MARVVLSLSRLGAAVPSCTPFVSLTRELFTPFMVNPRSMHGHIAAVSGQVSWSVYRIFNFNFSEFSDCVSHLISSWLLNRGSIAQEKARRVCTSARPVKPDMRPPRGQSVRRP